MTIVKIIYDKLQIIKCNDHNCNKYCYVLGNSGSLRIIDNYMNQINCYKYGHMTAILHTLGIEL
jgi:hypothetical protein